MDENTQRQAETLQDFGMSPEGWATYLKTEIKAAEADERVKKWRERGSKVIKRYRDERGDVDAGGHTKRYNILWSNIQTMLPAIFGKRPAPICARRYSDPDNVARVAALILERVLDYQLCAQREFVDNVRNALQDRLLPGIGTVWVRYQMSGTSPGGDVSNDVTDEAPDHQAIVDYVYWQDFGFTPSRTWEEVPMVWRRVYLTRDELVERFGEAGEEVPLNYTPEHHQNTMTENDTPKGSVFKQAEVIEVWDKRRLIVTWINPDTKEPLDTRPDPYNYPGFFPCPKPLFATNTTGNLTPVPDYVLYQDQATELDTVTQRLHMLTMAVKVVGVYDAEQTALQRMLTEGVENQMIPVDTWAAFAEKGGIKGTVDFMPLEKVIEVITQLTAIKGQMIQDIYQITGISDIIRGAASPNATATEQRIKAQFASVRLEDMKLTVAQFATDIMQLMAHLATKFFPADVLVAQSAIMQSIDGQKSVAEAQKAAMAAAQQQPPQPGMPPGPPPPQPADIIMQAVQMLKGDTLGYRVEVLAESMVEPDLQAERQARNDFLTAVTQFLQQAIPGVQAVPQLGPLLKGLLMWGVRGFRVGRDIEGMIESSMEAIASAPPQDKPDPKVEALKMKAQIDAEKAKADIANDQQRMVMDMQKMREELAAEREKAMAEIAAMREEAAAKLQIMREEAATKIELMRQQAAAQAEVKQTQAALDASVKMQQAEQNAEHAQQSHEMGLAQQAESAAHERAEKKEEGE